jgi:hypothetical protein
VTGHPGGRRCSICENEQVSRIDVLLAAGTPVRQVARIVALPRTTLARDAAHIAPTERRLGVIRTETGPSGPADPLAEAFALAERTRTPRERLRALEQIRSATKLRLRDAGEADAEDRELLDANVREAEAAYRDAPDFETGARALSGCREAIMQRLDAAPAGGTVEVPLQIALADGTLIGEPQVIRVRLEEHFRGVPKRFRDPARFVVQRRLRLNFPAVPTETPQPGEEVRVYDRANVLVWPLKGRLDDRPGQGRIDRRDPRWQRTKLPTAG